MTYSFAFKLEVKWTQLSVPLTKEKFTVQPLLPHDLMLVLNIKSPL